MPLSGSVRKKGSSNEMTPSASPIARPSSGGTSTVIGREGLKRSVDKTIPLRKVIKADPETLADSQPLSPETIGTVLKSALNLGGSPISTIVLVLLGVAVAYLLIRKRK